MSSTDSWPTKKADETLDYLIDWSQRIENDTIITSVFTILSNTGLSAVNSYFSNTTTTLWLTGGTDNTTTQIKNEITTIGGRTEEVIVNIQVRET